MPEAPQAVAGSAIVAQSVGKIIREKKCDLFLVNYNFAFL